MQSEYLLPLWFHDSPETVFHDQTAQLHPSQLNTIACIERHAGNPSFLDLQTRTQKPCVDSDTVGCNGAVSCSKSILPPYLSTSSLSPSLSLSIPLQQMKTGPHRGCRRFIGWDISQEWKREREREREVERKLKKMQLLRHGVLAECWAEGCKRCPHMISQFCLLISLYQWKFLQLRRITSFMTLQEKQQLCRLLWSNLKITWFCSS